MGCGRLLMTVALLLMFDCYFSFYTKKSVFKFSTEVDPYRILWVKTV